MPRKKKAKRKPDKPAEPKTGRGHPVDYEVADWKPVQCPKCGSHKRKNFQGNVRYVRDFGTRIHSDYGTEYNAILLRPTKCLDCGQCLMSREYRMETD